MSSPNNSGRFSRPTAPDRAGTLVALAESLFDEITRQAAQTCGSQAAALSLVEDGHHWFKSRGGVSPAETPRAIALCAETIRRKDVLNLADVRQDERFAGGPDDPRGIRFFAGAPIITSRAGAIGTISVMDIAVRELGAEQLAALAELAREAGRQFDIRLGANEVLASVAPEEPARQTDSAEPEFRTLVERLPARHVPDPGRPLPLRQPQARRDPRLHAARARRLRRRHAGGRRRPAHGARPHPRGPLRRVLGPLHLPGDPEGRGAHRRGGPRDGSEIDGRAALIGSMLDVTERKRAEAQVAERAFVDPLTRLPNRVRFMERLETELAQSRRYERKLAVVHLDLDKFKFVNDNWGHNVGDRLLQSLALRLTRGVREVDTIARIGADEFLVLVPGPAAGRGPLAVRAEAAGPRQPSGRHRRAHAPGHGERRRGHVSGRRAGRRHPAAQRGRGDVPRQGPRRQQLRALHARADRDGRRAARAPERPAAGARPRRAAAALPAARQHLDGPDGGPRGARALAASAEGLPAARHVHPRGRGVGPHPSPRRVGAARRDAASSRPGTRPASTCGSPSTSRPSSSGSGGSSTSSRTPSPRPGSSPSTSRSRSPNRSRWRARRSSSPT